MSRTQQRPTGLLDILGMNSAGDVPQEVMDSIVLTMEIKDLYLIGRAITNVALTTGYSSAALSWDTVTSPTHVVPEGFLRYLMNYSAYVYGLTTQVVDVASLWIGLPVGGGVYNQCGIQQTSDVTPTLAGQSGQFGLGSQLSLAKPVFIPAGGTFGCNGRTTYNVIATTYNVQHVSRWVDLRV